MVESSKTLHYLNSFKPSERKELISFLESPYFNKNKNLVRLLKEISKNVIDPASLFKKVTGQKYEEQKLRYLLSDLNKKIEEYLIHSRLEKHEAFNRQLLIEQLHEKKLYKYIPSHQDQLLNKAENHVLQDSDFLAIHLAAEETAFRFASQNDNRSLDSRLQKLSDSIDTHYFAKKLKYTCEMINRSNVLQVVYDIPFIDEVRSFLVNSRFVSVPAVSIYLHILHSLTDPDNEDHYRLLKTELVNNRNLFSDQELRDMFTFAQNYCIRRLNLGKNEYLEEMFSNYEFLLRHEIILSNQMLSQFDFKNIVTIALRLNRFEWVKKFIQDHLRYIPESERFNAEVYNLSRLYYSTGEIRKALKLMQDVEFTDIYYHLDAKALLLKIYYDTDSFESFNSLSKSFTNYLKRNSKVSAYQRTTYLNFVKIVVKMFNYKMFDKGSINVIRQAMDASSNVADISWLRQKAVTLEQ